MFHSYVVYWLQRQEERLLSSSANLSRESSYCGEISKTFSSAFKGNLQQQPSIHQSQKKYYIRRESTCSSNDPVDQMEFLTQEVKLTIGFEGTSIWLVLGNEICSFSDDDSQATR